MLLKGLGAANQSVFTPITLCAGTVREDGRLARVRVGLNQHQGQDSTRELYGLKTAVSAQFSCAAVWVPIPLDVAAPWPSMHTLTPLALPPSGIHGLSTRATVK